MELKDYQLKVLEYLDEYLNKLAVQYKSKLEYYEFQQAKGGQANHPETSDYCQKAWVDIKAIKAIYSSNYTFRAFDYYRDILADINWQR